MSSGDYGSGAGKGGGSGGSIRDAGGSFGKMEAAHEEEYFRKLTIQMSTHNIGFGFQITNLEHGKMEAAHEEEYFREMRAEQLKQLKEHEKIEEQFHENQIKVHEDAIKAHKKAIENLKTRDSDSD